jgi:hypothetical protein
VDSISFKVKDKIVKGDVTYLLLSMYENEILPETGPPNVIVLDKKGNILWVAEPPTTKYDIYARIYFEEDKFFAVTNAGQVHEIDEATGKVVNSRMVK